MSLYSQYMDCPYVDGGRGPVEFDCWGLVREVLHARFAVPLLPSFGLVCPDDKPAMTNGYCQIVKALVPSVPKAGAVMAGFVGQNLVHVGVCIDDGGLLKVLHTSRNKGVRLDSVRSFKRLFLRTEFYYYVSDNSGLPQ